MIDKTVPARAFDVVLIATPAQRREAVEAIALAGGQVAEQLGWDEEAVRQLRPAGHPVLAIVAEGAGDDVLAAALPSLRALAEAHDLPLVATFANAQIDLVAGALIGLRAQLLCEVGFAPWVGELAIAGRQVQQDGLADRWRESEAERLRTLNAEVARIAELLARLATREREIDSGQSEVEDRRQSFGIEPPATEIDPYQVRQAIRARRMRDSFFGDALFEDPAWDMLLDLFAAHLEDRRVSVSSLCIAAAVPSTTALRWIGRLTEAGLLERHPDPIDRRRAFMAMSAKALKGMRAYIAAIRKAGLPIA